MYLTSTPHSLYNLKHNYKLYNLFLNTSYSLKIDLLSNKSVYINDFFIYLDYNPFFYFFKNNNINVPICFNKSSSLLRFNNNNNFLKITSHLMRKGLKLKFIIIFFKSLNFFIKDNLLGTNFNTFN